MQKFHKDHQRWSASTTCNTSFVYSQHLRPIFCQKVKFLQFLPRTLDGYLEYWTTMCPWSSHPSMKKRLTFLWRRALPAWMPWLACRCRNSWTACYGSSFPSMVVCRVALLSVSSILSPPCTLPFSTLHSPLEVKVSNGSSCPFLLKLPKPMKTPTFPFNKLMPNIPLRTNKGVRSHEV